MRVGEAFDVIQFPILQRIVVDRVFRGQILIVLSQGTLLDIDRESKGCHAGVRHLAIDLRDPVVFEAIE